MIVHELMSMESVFAEELKEGYHVLVGKYKTVDVITDTDCVQEIDCGTEEIVEVVFDPGNEYSLIRLGAYTFEEMPSLDELQRTIFANHCDIFAEAVSA
ncbi:hypothetical protein GGR02_002060 [Anoxybacillus voinovskiensis]|uniref:Uncharacterized protein n=1 Tax=Anoxybacteroides voinovskiense TaxID=230470 RepID=A0A840DMK6_9BACL|nr:MULTISPECIES: hypothetical protein [Anoxybacillus]MBB4074294.1 hypothetical protein [Anoxybacillus voinovskiensis]MCL6587165.1 hypothetical protein [Anoxybacillus sp.]GGJ69715.1 hypothetical protein GCM10008982_18860 [Anoxybacillus voinovskiensis]